ncbi:MAG: B12-binding domain-containing radical SAM protein [Ignavibacteriae bacterium]|nr:B12-binding domain-containing radical SAM protein [Ignavibacteriota bacterium]
MSTIRFLMINPTSPLWRVEAGEKPRQSRYFRFSLLPSLYVAGSMPPQVQTRVLDEDVTPVDFDSDADIVGITFMTHNAPRAYEIADAFRARGLTVIVGGYHPTFMPEEAKQHADAVCIGDAEDVVPRMIRDYEQGALQPFYRSEMRCLDGLPQPDRRHMRRKDYVPADAVQATRGCMYQCEFCSVAAFHTSRFRTRPVAEVIDELRALRRHVIFMDDNIIGDRAYAMELFTAMIPLRKRWFSQCDIGLAHDEELLELAARSGCGGLFIGFETLSQQGLAGWKKESNGRGQYNADVEALHRAGIAICAGFVFGGDHDTEDVFGDTLAFLLDTNIEALQTTRMTPFPGTPLFDDLDAQGRIFDRDWSHYDFNHVVFEPRHMSPERLDRGVGWVGHQFYQRSAIARRVWKSLQYLRPGVALGGVLALNLGYRGRKSIDGEFARGMLSLAQQA